MTIIEDWEIRKKTIKPSTYKPGSVDKIYEIHFKNEYTEAGFKYTFIKPEPEEKRKKSIN